MMYRSIFISIVLLSRSLLLAQMPAASVEEEIVITASALPETVESTPAAVTVITREEIEERAARDVADLLREVPGLTLSRTGSAGRATSLFTRGSNSTHTLVLWNGVEINNPYFSGYDWGRFSTVGVEQIEVVRGPYSALYGSDAVAGVVNILTTPKKSELVGTFEAGESGLRNGALGATYAGKSGLFTISHERRSDDGFAENDDFEQESTNALLRWALSDAFRVGVALRSTSYDLGIPVNVDATSTRLIPSPDRRQDGTERQISIPIDGTVGRFGYEVTFAESRRRDDFSDPLDPFGLVDNRTESTTRRARALARVTTRIGTIVAGGEFENAAVDDRSNYGVALDGDERTERSFFIEDRYSREIGDASRLELAAGIRYDRYETFGSETSPRLAAAWIRGPVKFRAAYGEAFRAPSIGELYFPFGGNPALEAERSRSIEAGVDWVRGDQGVWSVTFFDSKYRDLIVYNNAVFGFVNFATASARGVEIGFEKKSERTWSSASYTLLDSDDGRGHELVRRPRHSGSLSLGYLRGTLDTSLTIRYTGARQDIEPVLPFGVVGVDAYTTADVTLQHRRGKLVPYIKLENITDEKYEEVLGYPSPGRRAVLGLRLTM